MSSETIYRCDWCQKPVEGSFEVYLRDSKPFGGVSMFDENRVSKEFCSWACAEHFCAAYTSAESKS